MVFATARPPVAASVAPGQGRGATLKQTTRQAVDQAGAMCGGFLPRLVGTAFTMLIKRLHGRTTLSNSNFLRVRGLT